MPKILEDESGENLQALTIETLAAELHVPIDQVRRTYQEQLARLSSAARVRDFLGVFAARNTRLALRNAGR